MENFSYELIEILRANTHSTPLLFLKHIVKLPRRNYLTKDPGRNNKIFPIQFYPCNFTLKITMISQHLIFFTMRVLKLTFLCIYAFHKHFVSATKTILLKKPKVGKIIDLFFREMNGFYGRLIYQNTFFNRSFM